MMNLKDTVLEKLRVDDIVFDEFPVDGTIDDAVKFLKNMVLKKLNLTLKIISIIEML